MTTITATKAYDGHMNLILSDVEETIAIVDAQDGVSPEQAAISVCFQSLNAISVALNIVLVC
jgi:U6 snRNA-associated Sm-like protein LSm3